LQVPGLTSAAPPAPLPLPAPEPSVSRTNRLLSQYNSHFDVRHAVDWIDLEQCHRMRYQVYCIENPYEDPADNPDGLEIDRFDGHAAHVLLRHKTTGKPVGAVRLILPWPGIPQNSFPIQQICAESQLIDPERMPLAQSAEISRFCLSKAVRRDLARQFDSGVELSPYVTLGLIRGLVQLSAEHAIRHWFIVVEPALLRFLKRLGLLFEPLGPLVEHHGMRQPCHADLDRLLAGAATLRPDVWSVITGEGCLWPPRARPAGTRIRYARAHIPARMVS
jgi:N-acyl amino acid synthase of PEP-CTERM/exosortase system